MVKIKIRTGRGTGTTEIDSADGNWTGDEFRKLQATKKLKSKNKTISSGRGTSSKKFKDIPDPLDRPSTEGVTRVSGRGTRSIKSEIKDD